ncbi:DUF421 domain-containing protein [Lysinibacillus sphaericus]|uniref:YetF C-terminal domain-containing protein n=3 Tax=Lysinibacillus TaxID=400634 RepID=B1HYH6_LYSSC|nr:MULTISPECIES: DUF421 domain-containing protein [Lysinibacillus]MBE5083148.1 DUF421 domain-containing protein [Bacillus thuringiensis]ACA40137.1 conserved hypothetical protein [Lysinibacillus sphaericus C3-41]AMO33799.1 hypothetical protein AR327_15860 [Lysinibacillus sphaericus]AMR91092.1 hypothetical protein A1T07_13350 [Lysinibacillus sphaericus]ANA45141.1 hypothetical protein A2J09_06015 [Lysinibacillus sphaericus]
MDLNLIWQTILIFIVGTIYLRISGRKTISQMTIPQTVILIAIGTLLIQPVSGRGLWVTFGIAGILVLSLLLTEYIQLKFDKAETAISGKAVPVIQNGILMENNLNKLRLTVDKLEERLRQVGVTNIHDIQYATIESNGQLGHTLKPEKQPATKEDIQNLIKLFQSRELLNSNKNSTDNIFTETLNKNLNTDNTPKHLQ